MTMIMIIIHLMEAHPVPGMVPSSGDSKMHRPCSHGVHSLAALTSINESATQEMSDYSFKVLKAVT